MKERIPTQFELFAQEIRTMLEKDQDMRKRALENNGVIESEEDDKIDAQNTETMKEIVRQMGWPTISKVGKEVSDMAELLVRHADHDVEFQKQCLQLMKEAKGDVDQINLAFLEDRVRVNEGRLQLYGTQFFGEGENYGPRPIEDQDHVDERRKAVGMESLAEYTKILKEKYNE